MKPKQKYIKKTVKFLKQHRIFERIEVPTEFCEDLALALEREYKAGYKLGFQNGEYKANVIISTKNILT